MKMLCGILIVNYSLRRHVSVLLGHSVENNKDWLEGIIVDIHLDFAKTNMFELGDSGCHKRKEGVIFLSSIWFCKA